MRKHYSANFKAKVVQEMLKEEKGIGQLAAEYGVSAKQLGRWKTIALENLPRLFEPETEQLQKSVEGEINFSKSRNTPGGRKRKSSRFRGFALASHESNL